MSEQKVTSNTAPTVPLDCSKADIGVWLVKVIFGLQLIN